MPPPDEVVNAPQPDRNAVGGSTRGTIACGDRRCTARTEMCFFGPAPGAEAGRRYQCVPSGSSPGEFRDARYRCDDASDCAAGEACCITQQAAGGDYACIPRARVNQECALEVCEEGGGPCPEGLSCRDGACSGLVRAECGPERKRCPAERPYCSYRRTGSRCVTSEETDPLFVEYGELPRDEPGGIYSCSRTADCAGGQKCCAANGGRVTFCAPTCDTVNGARVSECTELRAQCGKDAACTAGLRCAPQAVAPPWIKMCAGREAGPLQGSENASG